MSYTGTQGAAVAPPRLFHNLRRARAPSAGIRYFSPADLNFNTTQVPPASSLETPAVLAYGFTDFRLWIQKGPGAVKASLDLVRLKPDDPVRDATVELDTFALSAAVGASQQFIWPNTDPRWPLVPGGGIGPFDTFKLRMTNADPVLFSAVYWMYLWAERR